MSHPASSPSASTRRAQLGLCLGALGIVFGDIGTSPLYTMNECIRHLPPGCGEAGVLGVLSLMFWALTLVVGVKYVFFIMKADNHGEGGIFALLALAQQARGPSATRHGLGFATLLILGGAALLYGDGIITPAISVLGAAEGFESLRPGLGRWSVPIAVVILALLFRAQRSGTHRIGRIFGPVILFWFVVLGALGLAALLHAPGVLRAANPLHGLRLLFAHPAEAGALLGAVVLTVTGAEALYADMGHFGRKAITRGWWLVVFPGLLLNYFGQGAYALAHPDDATNPFFALAPAGAPRIGLVVLSIFAAIIASQALISGTFSLTRQAIQLGFFPRLTILHTNAEHEGQIYVPLINHLLAAGAIAVVIKFGSSEKLAAAYGIAVTGTMAVTTLAFYQVCRLCRGWSLGRAVGLAFAFLALDVALFAANLRKFGDGGWLPMTLAALVLVVMHAWHAGRSEIQEKVYNGAVTEVELSSIARSKSIVRVPGSAVFMVATPRGTPLALLHHLKANKCLQHTVVLLTIVTEDVPQVADEERLRLEESGEGVWRASGRYGYMESPAVGDLVERIRLAGVPINPQAATYYFNREMIISGGNARMFNWQKRLYAFLSRNARPVKDYYQISPTQIIEIGLPVQL